MVLVAEGTRASEPCGRWENGAHDLTDQAPPRPPAGLARSIGRAHGRSTERTVAARFSRRSLAAGWSRKRAGEPVQRAWRPTGAQSPALAYAASGFLTPPAGADWWGPGRAIWYRCRRVPACNRDHQGAETCASFQMPSVIRSAWRFRNRLGMRHVAAQP